MKHSLPALYKRGLSLLSVLSLCIGILPVGGVIPALAAENTALVPPDYVVDFSDSDAIDSCYDLQRCSAELKDGVMELTFADDGNGQCTDPYMSLSLDMGRYTCEVYPYLALLVKTNKQDLTGQLRFRTPSTGAQYPCQSFSYQNTDDWQVVVIHLTDRKSILFYPDNMTLHGGYTNIRLDMFDNACPVDTTYAIKAYAL